MIGLSAWRYNPVRRQIEAGNFCFLIWIMAAVVALFGLLRPSPPSGTFAA